MNCKKCGISNEIEIYIKLGSLPGLLMHIERDKVPTKAGDSFRVKEYGIHAANWQGARLLEIREINGSPLYVAERF